MDYAYLSVIGAMTGTLTMILVYIYLYLMYRERYIFIWAIAWFILFLRNLLFDSGMFNWKYSAPGYSVYQLLFITCALVFVWGTYIFINKSFYKWWLYGAAGASILSILFLHLPLPYKVIPPAWFGAVVLMWIGITLFRCLELSGFGKYITVYAFILWSILTLAMPFLITPYPIFVAIAGGALRMIIAVGTLLMYFEKARSDLINKETQFRLFAENAVDVIFRYRLLPEAKFEYISPSAGTVTGYSPEEYYADPDLFYRVVHPDDTPLLHNYLSAFDQPDGLPLTFRLRHKNQTVIWVEQKCVPIYDKANNIQALEGIIRDITARKHLEQITSWYDRMNMVGSMAATVAHEIRNPLTTVRGYLQYLSTKERLQTDRDSFHLMIEELDRANDIIREYLSLSQKKVADFELCSLNNTIESMFPLIHGHATGSKVSVKLNLSDIPELLLDEKEIRQLLLNLVRNSIEAMPSGGELIIRTFRKNKKIALSISDQGPGIPASILENLGTPFITTKDTGTGLGLPLCYQIAHRHNAVINVKTSNNGTTFIVYFNQPHPSG